MADPILDELDSENYYYGTTPKEAVAEQNQTYFAYFDTLADTSPILQDHTAYYVKYLIDTEGNPVNPEPDSNPNRPQAIGLYNLLNNFEVGKNAAIKTITNDPLYDIPPNSYMLNGSYPIAHVGRLTSIITTTTGSGPDDYARTMSFADLLGNPISINVANLYVQFRYTGNELNGFNGAFVPFSQELTSNQYWEYIGNNSIRFTYPGGTVAANTRIRIRVDLAIKHLPLIGSDGYVGARFIIYRNNVPMLLDNNNYYLDRNILNDWANDGPWGYQTLKTTYIDINENDVFKIYVFRNGTPPDSDSFAVGGVANGSQGTCFYIDQQTLPGDTFTSGVTGTTSSYWTVDTSNYEPLPGLSILTGSLYLTQLYNTPGLIQITPTASTAIGFPNISTPFYPILPGDKIKFTLNETEVHTIVNVNVGVIGPPLLFLTLTPPVDALTSLDNFTLYRIINDGTSVILEVKKDISGSAYAGVVQPQFISNELVNNYDKIITNLTEKGLIN